MNRRGIQMGVNVLVVMILGFIIVAGGMVMMAKLLDSTDPLVREITAGQRAELQRLLTAGQLVAVTPQNQGAKAGEEVVYHIAIENRLSGEYEFIVGMRVKNETGEEVLDDKISLLWPERITLAPNEQQFLPLIATVQEAADQGPHDIIVSVTYNGGQPYDAPAFFTLTVR